ncbi:MAG: type I-E CRISPR-associated protein Cse1/CasA, partial [Methylohalobius sp. ZOD2]
MHLIDEPWIPIRRVSGKTELIRPAQIAKSDDPAVVLTSPRADFNGALAQFLIGLLQTTFAPRNDDEWAQFLDQPPTVKALEESFAKVTHAFQLDGNGARFMQESSLLNENFDRRTIDNWLIEVNEDHFNKRGRIKQLCPPCTAIALFSHQINAPEGGRGHFTSLRGGGPLTTLVIAEKHGPNGAENLWHDLWRNVLDQTEFPIPTTDEAFCQTFPWLTSDRFIKASIGRPVYPDDFHPCHYYWSMSKRFWLETPVTEKGACHLCGARGQIFYSSYATRPNGIQYDKGPLWQHPLSPYKKKGKAEDLLVEHPRRGGVTYRHWLGYSYSDSRSQTLNAKVVATFLNSNRKLEEEQFQLWAFGYDMKSNKARCWYETNLPLYLIPEAIRETFSNRVGNLIEAAEYVADLLKRQIKQAWFKRPRDIRGDVSFLADGFYQHTEGNFYTCAHDLIQAIPEDTDYDILARWHRIVVKAAFDLFDEWTTAGDIAFSDPRRIAQARDSLRKGLYQDGEKLRFNSPYPIAG